MSQFFQFDVAGWPIGNVAVRMLRDLGLLHAGDVLRLPARQASRWVAEGVAEYVSVSE